MPSAPAASVAILSHNRCGYLLLALESLRVQELAVEAREIIVVLNACTDGSREAVEAQFGGLPGLVVVDERALGVCNARNRALRMATAPIIAFLDDDAIASPSWLGRIVEAFARRDASTVAVGGPVQPIWESPRPSWLPPALDTFLTIVDFGGHEQLLGAHQYLVGANMAFRTSALRGIGGFSAELDRTGSLLLSNGDLIVQDRLRAGGGEVWYDPRAMVRHHVSGSRLNPQWFWERGYWQGYSDAMMSLRLHGTRRWSRSRRLVWAVRQLARHPAAAASLLGGPRTDRALAQFTGRRVLGYLHASISDRWTAP